ncbi:MAG: dihydrolipoyl dehydrogenase [Rhodocyclaceae bacterium]|nr:dihydrolipoyl dehydrogenase [Rhodocyclaceae bacterium]
MSLIDVKVPDIGDFKDVPVIEVLVKAGDVVQAEDPLITLESDKATMDVPSPVAGKIVEVLVKVGDKVSEGAPIVRLDAQAASQAPAKAPAASPLAAPAAAVGSAARAVDLIVLGGGPGGYSAAFRAADLGLRTAIVERYPTLGGVCLNVGCIPSKALLHVAAAIEEARQLASAGVSFDAPRIDLEALRRHKAGIVAKLTGGLAAMAKARNVEIVRGYGHFLDAHHLEIEETTGSGQEKTGKKSVLRFERCIIAAGSSAVRLPVLPEDARIIDATGALALPFAPERMLVIGGGIIGLEMATVYASLGARIDLVELTESLMAGADRDAVKVWEKTNRARFAHIWLETRVAAVDAKPDGLWVHFAGEHAPRDPQRYDLILQAAGRTPNGKKIDAEKAGVFVDERGYIPVDAQMRTNVPHIFAIGDIVGVPMLAHKAVHQGHVAAEAAAGHRAHFDALVIPSVAYTHPEVAWVGLSEDEARRQGRAVDVAKFPWAASGRALAMGAEAGFTKLLFDAKTRRIVGGVIVGPSAGDLIGEIALAIEMGADAEDIGQTIHPHPTLAETIGLAAEVAQGCCTDLPPTKKRVAG